MFQTKKPMSSNQGQQNRRAKIFLALDVEDKSQAFFLFERFSSLVQGFKVGPRLGFKLSKRDWVYLSKGPCDLFIDYKFFDIPSTVLASVRAAFKSGASHCSVHALNGAFCLRELLKLEKELNAIRPFKILSVTLLTSFDQDTNALPLVKRSSETVVKRLTHLVSEAGLGALVCSPHEAPMVKSIYPKMTLVCPGVRLKKDSKGDQKRVMTPGEAFQAGADYLVMGRSLINLKDPEAFFKDSSKDFYNSHQSQKVLKGPS